MTNRVRIRKSSVAGKIPTTAQIEQGELAVNFRDGKLYTIRNDGTTDSVIRLDNLRSWESGYSYKTDDIVLAEISSVWRLFRADSNFTSSGTSFPGGQSVGTEWVEVSPSSGGGGGGLGPGAGLSSDGANLNVGTASTSRIVVNADDIDLATAGTAGTYDKVTTDAYGRVVSGSTPDRGGAGLTQTGDVLDVGGTTGRIVVNADSVDLATAGTAGTYTKTTTDAYGRVVSGESPSSYVDLGLTDVQPLDATLSALAALATAADQLIYATGSDSFATSSLSSFARTLLDDITAAAMRATLELGTIATQDANNVSITGGNLSNVTVASSAYNNGTIDNCTITNSSIGGSAIVDWSTGTSYTAGDLILTAYQDERRIFECNSSHTSSGTSFPGGQSVALPNTGFTGEWREISPLRGEMGDVQFEGAMAYASSLTPPTLSGTVNNYNPTGLSETNFLRLEASGSGATLTGLQAPSPVVNQGVFICNVGTKNITISDDNTGSTTTNRFLLGGNRTLQGDEGIMLIYDDVTLRWRSQAIQI